jgi:PTH1 family peptidyl-tRNA hydrolase
VKIVVGLGNPGKQYDGTRHNVGWMVLDRIADRAGWSGRGKERDSAYSVRGRWADTDLLLVKPLTFMNLSGLAVRKALARERVPMEDLLVVVDDFALPLGRMRLREEGSAGGHNGLKSIIAEMGTQKFARLRVGIGEPGRNVVDHVLSRFAASEQADLTTVLGSAATAVEDWAREGTNRAANKWNAWSLPAPAVDPAPAGGAKTNVAEAPGVPVAPSSTADTGRSAPDANGVVRTKTGWRRILPSGGHEEHDR